MPEIQRYFSEGTFDNFKDDFTTGKNPLIKTIKESGGELDFQIRPDNKFNLYYKGNSLAEVDVQRKGYKVKIHHKFGPVEASDKDEKKRFHKDRFVTSQDYCLITLERNELLSFFQSKIIHALSSKITSVNNGEEITFEQSLITDNLDSEDFIIIDRQVSGGGVNGIIDLLGLKKIDRGMYRFVILEVKLGRNKELRDKVAIQIESYMRDMEMNVSKFQACYEKNYQQKKEMGLFPKSFPDRIKIDDIIEGMIVVGLYSNIGSKYIEELTKKHPRWQTGKNIIQFKNKLVG